MHTAELFAIYPACRPTAKLSCSCEHPKDDKSWPWFTIKIRRATRIISLDRCTSLNARINSNFDLWNYGRRSPFGKFLGPLGPFQQRPLSKRHSSPKFCIAALSTKIYFINKILMWRPPAFFWCPLQKKKPAKNTSLH